MSIRLAVGLPACYLVAAFSSPLDAQISSVSAEAQVNTFTTGVQYQPSVAADATGRSLTAWASFGQDGSGYGIYAQRRDQTGATTGTEFALNSTTQRDQRHVRLAAEGTDRYAAVWQSDRQGGRDGWEVVLRYFRANGTAATSELPVNVTAAGHQRRPSVATNATGSVYAVVWEGAAGLQMRLFDRLGTALTGEITVHSSPYLRQSSPDVAVASDGTVTVAWQSPGQGGNAGNVYARRFGSDGVALAVEFAVAQDMTAALSNPRVDVADDGTTAIVWQQQAAGSSAAAFLMAYSADGTALGTVQPMSSAAPTYPQTNPVVAVANDRLITAAWNGTGRDGDADGVYVRVFDASQSGSPSAMGTESQANQTTAGFQQSPAVTAGTSGGRVVWQDGYRLAANGTSADGSAYGIFGATYQAVRPPVPAELLNFDATAQSSTTKVSWHTASEINVSHYEVEHSSDGYDFAVIDDVAAAGSATSDEHYTITHLAPTKGANYYRLHVLDLDGSAEYSAVRVVYFEGALNAYSLLPNPTHDFVRIVSQASTPNVFGRVSLIDPLGKLLSEREFSGEASLDLSGMPNGYYSVIIQSNTSTEAYRVIKQ